MKLSELEIGKMSLSERGLWLQCETMELEIATLKDALSWYAEQSMKINAYALADDRVGVLAVAQALAIDNGGRAQLSEQRE